MKEKQTFAGIILLALLFSLSQPANARLFSGMLVQGGAPKVVSYQGYVSVDGSPYNGTGYFKFAVVNAAGDTTYWSNNGTSSGGGAPTAAVSLAVSGGLFSVLLGDTTLANMTALPATAFSEPGRYLRVWFSSDNITFSLLTPDRRVAAVPYALQAEEAKHAATAMDADTLDGQHASAFQQHYANVVVVAKSGGDYATITAALDSITTASDSNRYLVRVMPGVYNERVMMKQYVDIEGSGELTTRITYTGSADIDIATLRGANNAELRFLTVENTGGDWYAIAICNFGASPRLTHVTASASGSTDNFGVLNNGSIATVMTHVSANASGGTTSYGVANFYSSTTITNSTIRASAGTNNYGVYNYASGSSQTVKIHDSQVAGSSNTIRNNSGSAILIGSTQLDGGGVYIYESTVTCAGVYDEAYIFYENTCP